VPGLRLAAPRDEDTLRRALREAVDVEDAPTVVRYPKGAMGPQVPAVDDADGVDVLARHDGPAGARAVLVVGVGAMAATAVEVGARLATHGLRTTVVDPRWVLPVPDQLVKLMGEHDHVVTIEDGLVEGGVGDQVARAAAVAGVTAPVLARGIPRRFLPHATRDQLLDELRLRPADVVRDVLAALG